MKSERVSDHARKKCMKNWGICYTGNDVTRSILTVRPDTDTAREWKCKMMVLCMFGIRSAAIVLIFFYLPQANRRQYSLQSLWNKRSSREKRQHDCFKPNLFGCIFSNHFQEIIDFYWPSMVLKTFGHLAKQILLISSEKLWPSSSARNWVIKSSQDGCRWRAVLYYCRKCR